MELPEATKPPAVKRSPARARGRWLLPLVFGSCFPPAAGAAEKSAPLADFWVDDDLPTAFARARETGKPLLAVFRCPP